jgi:hypothetical protein
MNVISGRAGGSPLPQQVLLGVLDHAPGVINLLRSSLTGLYPLEIILQELAWAGYPPLVVRNNLWNC